MFQTFIICNKTLNELFRNEKIRCNPFLTNRIKIISDYQYL